MPVEILRLADEADAILLGAVGGPKWDNLPAESRPERGLPGIRKYLGLNANLRPIKVFAELANASTLRPEVVSGLDMMIVRELTGDIYFGQPRGIRTSGFERGGYNTMEYSESEIALIAEMAFRTARKRRSKVISVNKMNVLECMQLWRDVVTKVGDASRMSPLSTCWSTMRPCSSSRTRSCSMSCLPATCLTTSFQTRPRC